MDEAPFQIARREAFEEIGLPLDDSKIPRPFRIEHLCRLPFAFARTALAVAPCVAFLHSDDHSGGRPATVEDNLIPRLDAKEVAAVFSAPFHNFLRAEDEVPEEVVIPGKRSDWYDGVWMTHHGTRWKMHNFYVPITNQKVSKPKVRDGGQAALSEHLDEAEEEEGLTRYKVWGMTAKILVDAARVAYGEEPDFEHNPMIGDEHLIEMLEKTGGLKEKDRGAPDLTQANMKVSQTETASNAKI